MTVIEIKPHRNGWKVFEAGRACVFAERSGNQLCAEPREFSLR
jgi:hypothetical protein